MSRRARAATGTALLAAAALVGSSVASAPATAHAPTAQERRQARDLQVAKQASARFHDVRAAIAAGYQPTRRVRGDPEGRHGTPLREGGGLPVDRPDEPAVLLYAPHRHGGVRLAGRENAPDRYQDLSTDDDRPSMFGKPFDGPMEGHVDGMPKHYDPHVWLWKHNPAGLFTPRKTSFTC